MVGLLNRAQIMGLTEPANTWLWNFTVTGVSDLNILDPIYVLNATIPFESIQYQPRFRGGRNYMFPGFKEMSSLQFTFYETQSYYITSWLRQWRNLVVDEDGLFGRPSDYVGVGELIAFDTTGVPRCSITLNGMQPSSPGGLSWNQDSRQLEVSHDFVINSIDLITPYTLADNILSALGISNSDILGDVGLGLLGRFI